VAAPSTDWPSRSACTARAPATLKKFVVLTYGFTPPTDEIKRAWGAWFASVGPRLVDPGSPFGRGVELSTGGRTELSLDSPAPLVGYCILNAESLQEAEELLSGMPIIDSVRVYESQSMEESGSRIVTPVDREPALSAPVAAAAGVRFSCSRSRRLHPWTAG
jgi:hypothetical protein